MSQADKNVLDDESVNLMWRPKGRLDGVMIGGEFEYADRTNNDNSSNNANRITGAVWYDF
jgi:hypothetical protein